MADMHSYSETGLYSLIIGLRWYICYCMKK